MEYKDYYGVLDVKKDATQAEIKSAYRKLARQYHPDLNKDEGAEDKFKEIGEAHEILKDPEKRAAYDQLGSGYQPGQDFTPPPNWDAGFEYSGGSPDMGAAGARDSTAYSEFFEDLFGQAMREKRAQQAQFHTKGQDHHAKILVDLDDVFTGAKRAIQLQVPKVTADGHVITEQRTLNVNIPKGLRAGQHIRLKGQGTPGLGKGEAGDLYLEVSFKPHPHYRAQGHDLYLDLPVAPWEAALGGKVKAPTPGGSVDVTIPANSSGGKKMRLKGRGIPGKTPGDLYITLQISLPPASDDKAKKLYEKMAEELAFNPRAKLGV